MFHFKRQPLSGLTFKTLPSDWNDKLYSNFEFNESADSDDYILNEDYVEYEFALMASTENPLHGRAVAAVRDESNKPYPI